ncbi:hypothetical protein [Methylocucumis oryzae]|nr:hypothetical protein [Methylocucumis oryzae]
MSEQVKDKKQPNIREISSVPGFDSATIVDTEDATKGIATAIEVKNTMPSIPNRNRDDNGRKQDES